MDWLYGTPWGIYLTSGDHRQFHGHSSTLAFNSTEPITKDLLQKQSKLQLTLLKAPLLTMAFKWNTQMSTFIMQESSTPKRRLVQGGKRKRKKERKTLHTFCFSKQKGGRGSTGGDGEWHPSVQPGHFQGQGQPEEPQKPHRPRAPRADARRRPAAGAAAEPPPGRAAGPAAAPKDKGGGRGRSARRRRRPPPRRSPAPAPRPPPSRRPARSEAAGKGENGHLPFTDAAGSGGDAAEGGEGGGGGGGGWRGGCGGAAGRDGRRGPHKGVFVCRARRPAPPPPRAGPAARPRRAHPTPPAPQPSPPRGARGRRSPPPHLCSARPPPCPGARAARPAPQHSRRSAPRPPRSFSATQSPPPPARRRRRPRPRRRRPPPSHWATATSVRRRALAHWPAARPLSSHGHSNLHTLPSKPRLSASPRPLSAHWRAPPARRPTALLSLGARHACRGRLRPVLQHARRGARRVPGAAAGGARGAAARGGRALPLHPPALPPPHPPTRRRSCILGWWRGFQVPAPGPASTDVRDNGETRPRALEASAAGPPGSGGGGAVLGARGRLTLSSAVLVWGGSHWFPGPGRDGGPAEKQLDPISKLPVPETLPQPSVIAPGGN